MGAPTEGEKRSVEEYNHNFWDMLRGLRIWDSVPWPAEVPQDTGNDKWAFCFDGEPLNASCSVCYSDQSSIS